MGCGLGPLAVPAVSYRLLLHTAAHLSNNIQRGECHGDPPSRRAQTTLKMKSLDQRKTAQFLDMSILCGVHRSSNILQRAHADRLGAAANSGNRHLHDMIEAGCFEVVNCNLRPFAYKGRNNGRRSQLVSPAARLYRTWCWD